MSAPHTTIQTAPAVRETTATTGTGTFSLEGAVSGFQTFVAGIGDGNVCTYYARLRNGAEWEWGIGTVTDASPDTLSRTTVLRSSNSDSAVNFSAGIKDIFIGAHPGATPHVAAAAPTAGDDNDGANGTFLPGSLWVDTAAGVGYLCLDDTDGAAVWAPVTNTAKENLLLNGDFSQWYRQKTGFAGTTDDTYFVPKWYTLLQGTDSTVAREDSLVSSARDANFGCRLVAGGTTNRFGIAQIVEAQQSWTLQGREAIFQAAMRCNLNAGSGSMNVRMALLEWTGSYDQVTSDVVNDWTSSDYSAGNFFLGSNVTVAAVEQCVVGHSAWDVYSVRGTISNGCDNVIVMIWTEDAPAHADDFLTITEAGLYEAVTKQAWRHRHNERALCERFCQRMEPTSVGTIITSAFKTSSSRLKGDYFLSTPMRTNPTLSHTITSYNNSGVSADNQMDAERHSDGAIVQITGSLTLSAGATSKNVVYVYADAGTSWDGSQGDSMRLRLGRDTDDYVILDAEL